MSSKISNVAGQVVLTGLGDTVCIPIDEVPGMFRKISVMLNLERRVAVEKVYKTKVTLQPGDELYIIRKPNP